MEWILTLIITAYPELIKSLLYPSLQVKYEHDHAHTPSLRVVHTSKQGSVAMQSIHLAI